MTLDSGRPGKTVLVIAGVHGDERSGVVAARRLAAGKAPLHGKLIIVPEANPAALVAGTRTGPDGADFNRLYPGQEAKAASEGAEGAHGSSGLEVDKARARAIFALALHADLVIDLHEEGLAWAEADLPTLVFSPPSASFVLDLVETLGDTGRSFAFTGGAPAGSLVAELGARGRSSILVEAPARLPLDERVSLHLGVVETVLALFAMR